MTRKLILLMMALVTLTSFHALAGVNPCVECQPGPKSTLTFDAELDGAAKQAFNKIVDYLKNIPVVVITPEAPSVAISISKQDICCNPCDHAPLATSYDGTASLTGGVKVDLTKKKQFGGAKCKKGNWKKVRPRNNGTRYGLGEFTVYEASIGGEAGITATPVVALTLNGERVTDPCPKKCYKCSLGLDVPLTATVKMNGNLSVSKWEMVTRVSEGDWNDRWRRKSCSQLQAMSTRTKIVVGILGNASASAKWGFDVKGSLEWCPSFVPSAKVCYKDLVVDPIEVTFALAIPWLPDISWSRTTDSWTIIQSACYP